MPSNPNRRPWPKMYSDVNRDQFGQPVSFASPFTDERKWIEIKGRFMGDAREKWEWFHKKYPDSELWNERKLKELGIPTRK